MNKKGFVIFLIPQIVFGICGLAAIWHIPAWSKAKAEGKTTEYQAQQMWPQQVFAKLPGGEAKAPAVIKVAGNGGNFEGGMSN